MATERSNDDDGNEKSYVERAFPDPRDMLQLMVSVQRLHQQLMWQMGEVMSDMMSMPLKRDKGDDKKTSPLTKAVSDLADAVDSATETLQRGGKPHTS